jgi:hypothetical protein
MFPHVPNVFLKGVSLPKHQTFIPHGLPKVLPFSTIYLGQLNTLFVQPETSVLGSFQSFCSFFCDEPIKMANFHQTQKKQKKKTFESTPSYE